MASNNQFELLGQRRFLPYFLTQFLGAFNDNVYKNALIILIAFQGTALTAINTDTLINLSAGLFILPFFLFSATAGQLADKYEKAYLIRLIKLLEVFIMIFGGLGLLLHNLYLMIVMLFLIGTQSTLFGPIKYSILPQHLKEEELMGGNGMVEMGTFLAILLGTMLGGILVTLPHGEFIAAITVISLAWLGYFTSYGIPYAAPDAPDLRINWNPITETWNSMQFARSNRTIFLSILGMSWFWFLGSVYLAQLPNYTKFTLGGNEHVVTLLLTLFSLGIGIGSLLCEKLSDHKVELGLVPLGSIGITLFGIDLFFAYSGTSKAELIGVSAFLQTPGSWRVLVDIVFIGLFGGLYIVPLYALVQQRSEHGHLARIIASNNIINALFMVLSAVIAILLLNLGFTIPQLFLMVALCNAAVAVYIYSLVPEFLMRFIVWILIHTMYRVDKVGLENIPHEGAVVLVCNHVSFVDALVIAGCVRRPPRFVMYYKIYQLPVLNFVFRTAKTIPIAGAKENPDMLNRAYEQIAQALSAGDVVCIFPEGQLTRDGELNVFRPGIERIIQSNPVPVIPIALQGLWGSFFSLQKGSNLIKALRSVWAKIGLVVGQPLLPEQVTATGLQEQVLALRGDWR